MEGYSIEGSSSKDALLQASPTTPMSATDETTQQPPTIINPLAWWRRLWRQWRPGESEQQREQQDTDAMHAPQPPLDESGHTPTTVADAGYALLLATQYAGTATLYGAYNVKYRGSQDDIAYAEMTVQIALATAVAAYAAAPKCPPPHMWWASQIPRYADCAAMNVEAAYAAISASDTASWSLTSIAGVFPWPRVPLPKPDHHRDIDKVVESIITAATMSAAAVQSAVEAALTTTMTTTMTPPTAINTPEKGRQVPYDVEDVSRLCLAGTLAQASAASASAAASAVRAAHPVLASRAARAASTAIAASTNATIMRLKVQAALAPALSSKYEKHEKNIHKWLTKLESLRSRTARPDLNTCMSDLNELSSEAFLASQANWVISETTALRISSGRVKVNVTGGDCDSDMSDESSSTVAASTPAPDN
ncbi:hypothetical protein F503_02170 [Ophiostoma piceae UAMH 11346]|uniref:Uncharacterized protein n=1 Tax=Ophiostoma piceae (strain UAMH 11346) TaxID=1262450 RepID=S3C136_OPHP1|nr:hypothetical protein F503_02170 [Ophiostoma piceae UAMH 11346]